MPGTQPDLDSFAAAIRAGDIPGVAAVLDGPSTTYAGTPPAAVKRSAIRAVQRA